MCHYQQELDWKFLSILSNKKYHYYAHLIIVLGPANLVIAQRDNFLAYSQQ